MHLYNNMHSPCTYIAENVFFFLQKQQRSSKAKTRELQQANRKKKWNKIDTSSLNKQTMWTNIRNANVFRTRHTQYTWNIRLVDWLQIEKKAKKNSKKNREISTIMKNSLRHSHTAHRHWFRHCYEYEYSIKIEKKILETSNPL